MRAHNAWAVEVAQRAGPLLFGVGETRHAGARCLGR